MLKYIIKRILQAIPLLLLITIISFIIINAAPGDPVNMFINPETKSMVDLEKVRHELGLDKSMTARYFIWLGNMFKGNFGESYFYRRPVWDMMTEALPNTIILSLFATILSLVVAIPAGIISATKRNSFWDYLFSIISFIGVSLPGFWLALMLILLFSLQLGWLPSSGMRVDFLNFSLLDRAKHLILPVIVLGTGTMASDMRYMRSAMLEVIKQDYMKTAKSKGLSPLTVIYKHGLRNALLPVITLIGFIIPDLIGGAAIVESIFAWPGIGRIIVEANFTRDYPVIMGNLVLSAALVVLGSLIADILYAVADPRIKYD